MRQYGYREGHWGPTLFILVIVFSAGWQVLCTAFTVEFYAHANADVCYPPPPFLLFLLSAPSLGPDARRTG